MDPVTQAAAVTAVATFGASVCAVWGARRAQPKLQQEVPTLEPRLSGVEAQQEGWSRLLDRVEAEHTAAVARLEDDLREARAALRRCQEARGAASPPRSAAD